MRLDPLDPNNQYNFAISKIQDGGGSHLKNSKKRNISVTERQFLTKFGTVMGLDLQTASAIKISRIQQSKMVTAAILKKRKILIPSQPIDRF